MAQTPWLNNPIFKNMNPLKIQVITELAENASGKPLSQTVPYLLKAQQTLKAANLSFSAEESALLMEILTKDMTPEEKQQVERMKALINLHIK